MPFCFRRLTIPEEVLLEPGAIDDDLGESNHQSHLSHPN